MWPEAFSNFPSFLLNNNPSHHASPVCETKRDVQLTTTTVTLNIIVCYKLNTIPVSGRTCKTVTRQATTKVARYSNYVPQIINLFNKSVQIYYLNKRNLLYFYNLLFKSDVTISFEYHVNKPKSLNKRLLMYLFHTSFRTMVFRQSINCLIRM